jgi:hypothetical protein
MKILKALKIKHLQSSTLTALAALSLLAAGCTKERPYKEVFVDEDTHTAKSLLTEAGKGQKKAGDVYPDDVYLYFPSTVNVSRTTTASRPHWAGDAKLVKIKFTKDALKVVEIEKDPRFKDNDLNNAAVLSIPVKHMAFKCVEDADGKCTNAEGENNDISWEQKDHFQVLVKDIKVEEVNFFPEQLSNLYFPCNNNIGQEFAHYDVSKDGLNIQVDKTYRANIMCLGDLESLSDLTFKVRYHFSLIKLNTLVKQGYKPLEYLKGEENTFGFFDTRVKTLDSDNNQTVTGEKGFVNRWRPGSKVVYHLSENFNKPANASIKKATLDAVSTINNSLAKAGANLELVVAEPSTQYKEGDLRLNSIILEEDPLATGLLGYGPSIPDPMTGEIVNARTVMYIGTMKKYLKNSYDELVQEKLNALAEKAGQAGSAQASMASKNAKPASLTFSDSLVQSFINKVGADAVSVPGHQGSRPSFNQLAAEYSKAAELLNVSGDHKHKGDKFAKHSHGLREVTRARSDVKGQLEAFLSENCMYDAEIFNFTGAIEDEVDKVIAEVGLKPWIALTAQEQDKVINALLPFVWIPTFVHELGHNLGLRHNFGASEDKANFYSDKELKDMGIQRKFEYSSVMDYPYKSTNELQVMGKYDVAALQFGYAEKIELKDGTLISLDQYRAEKPEIKEFNFCTDEHVGINPNCNRFDEGTSMTEIALHHAKAYEESYSKRNFRNNKLNFSLYHDASYMRSVGSHFDSIRAMFERYENIKRSFSLADSDPIWESNEFLKDLKVAVVISAAFMKKVVTTSDLLCAIAAKKNPTSILGVLPLKELARSAATCFDTENVGLSPEYIVVAQGGKLFQSAKDPRNGNPYLDQIDVRGIWIDKLLAIETMVARKTGIRSFDDFNDNMLDVSDIAGPVRETLESILKDEIVSDITFVTSTGQTLEAQIPVQFYRAEDAKNGHIIEEPLSEGLAERFGLATATPFNEQLIAMLKLHMPSKAANNSASSLMNSIKVLQTAPNDGRPMKDFETVTLGGDGFLAHKSSAFAVTTIQTFKGVSAIETAVAAAEAKTEAEKNKIVEAALTKVIEVKKAGKTLEKEASPLEKQLFAVNVNTLEKFAAGSLQDSSFYAQNIRAMAQ